MFKLYIGSVNRVGGPNAGTGNGCTPIRYTFTFTIIIVVRPSHHKIWTELYFIVNLLVSKFCFIVFRYFEDFEKKIPRTEIKAIENKLKALVFDLDSNFTITICGSFR